MSVCLLRALPQTSIKHLKLSNPTIRNNDLRLLAPLLEHGLLETLVLNIDEIADDGAQLLAAVLENNQTIWDLHLGKAYVSFENMQVLIR
ncbi:unnamed protein product, partial [Aphanomyces euteiches]